MKVRMKNRTYEYDYKLVLIKPDVHQQFKSRAKQDKLTMSQYLEKLLNIKQCQCPNGEN